MLQQPFVGKLFPVLRSRNKMSISVSPGVYVAFCVLLLVLPLQWVLAWLLAAAIHECAHNVILRLCNVPVVSFALTICGAKIHVGPCPVWKECLSAIAGPISGTVLMIFGQQLPYLAVCAFLQTILNIVPIKEFDGGRVINCLLRLILNERLANMISGIIEIVSLVVILSVGAYLTTANHKLILIPVVCAMLIMRRLTAKIPCKRAKQIVQCIQSNIRGTRHE